MQDSLPLPPTLADAVSSLPPLPAWNRFGYEHPQQYGEQPLTRLAQWCRTVVLPRGGGRADGARLLCYHQRRRHDAKGERRGIPHMAWLQRTAAQLSRHWGPTALVSPALAAADAKHMPADEPTTAVCSKDDQGATKQGGYLHPEQRRALTVAGAPRCCSLLLPLDDGGRAHALRAGLWRRRARGQHGGRGCQLAYRPRCRRRCLPHCLACREDAPSGHPAVHGAGWLAGRSVHSSRRVPAALRSSCVPRQLLPCCSCQRGSSPLAAALPADAHATPPCRAPSCPPLPAPSAAQATRCRRPWPSTWLQPSSRC